MNALPDIASQACPDQPLPLDWVGMCGIALPVILAGQRQAARADAGVDLADGRARGIHMSRLYLALAALQQEELTPALLHRVLADFLASHSGLSRRANLALRLEALLERPALVSPLAGWKAYPLQLDACLDARGFHVELGLEIGYSSTCPCSAALARQLIQQRFATDFAGRTPDHAAVLAWMGSAQGIVATPHSQRSTARIRVRLAAGCTTLPVLELIEPLEAALGTALQTAVKRADEQAFALANGQNPMFCEDAARRLSRCLRTLPMLAGFRVRVEHAESLHAHDAVAESRWNWPGD